MADKNANPQTKEAEKKAQPSSGSGHAKKENAVHPQEVKSMIYCLFFVVLLFICLSLGFGGQALATSKVFQEDIDNHVQHANIELKIENATAFTIVKSGETEITVEHVVLDKVSHQANLQKNYSAQTIKTGMVAGVHRVLTENTVNPVFATFTNEALDSSLSLEVNGEPAKKYASLSTNSSSSSKPNLVLLRQNDANVGIGTEEPQARLHVSGDLLSNSANAQSIKVKNSAMTKNVFQVTPAGNVGVGVESPSKALEVSGDTEADSIVLKQVSDLADMTCSTEGKLIYYKNNKKVMICNGNSWVNLGII